MTTTDQLLNQAVEKIYPSQASLSKLLKSGKKIKVYQGFDPTGIDLHIGHTVGLRKLRQFQDLGHQVIFLFGDFTATIGDPTGKSQARNRLTPKQVKKNADKYLKQASKIVNFSGDNPAQVLYNSKWLKSLTFEKLIDLASHFTLAQIIERDMFQERIKKQEPIYLHEFFYPLMQGYDSVAMNVDLEIGGTDQTFNMLTGRTLMKTYAQKEKFVMTLKLLTDSQGVKIGKTEGNAIALDNPPDQMYGQIMSLSDDSIIPIFELVTDIKPTDLKTMKASLKKGANPMTAKKKLAHTIVLMYHSENKAKRAQKEFEHTFQKRQTPTSSTSFSLSKLSDAPAPTLPTVMVATQLASSKSHAKQLITGGTVNINSQKILDPTYIFGSLPSTLQVGKKKTIVNIIK